MDRATMYKKGTKIILLIIKVLQKLCLQRFSFSFADGNYMCACLLYYDIMAYF